MTDTHHISPWEMQHFTGHDEVEEILRSEDFRPALHFRDSAPLLNGCVLTLGGDEHLSRRRLQRPLFERRALAHYEHAVLGDSLGLALEQAARNRGADGRPRIDLMWLTRMTLVPITAAVVGLDGVDTEERIVRLEDISRRLGEGASVEWSTRDHAEVMAEAMEAKDDLLAEFYSESLLRRRDLVARWRAGEVGDDDLPIDLLTIVLCAEGDDFDEELWLREALFFVVASANTTTHATPHVFNEIVEWMAANPGNDDVTTDIETQSLLHGPVPALLRRAMSDRDVDGRHVGESEDIACMLRPANTDTAEYGDTAGSFDPRRADSVGRRAAHGLSFGAGAHLCSGRPLAIGLPGTPEGQPQVVGVLPRLLHELFARGAEPDPDDPPRWRTDTEAGRYEVYPLVFTNWPD